MPTTAEAVSRRKRKRTTGAALDVVSLFSGIGALDRGLEAAGARVVEMCESWEPARRVLKAHYPHVDVHADVATFRPKTDYHILAAGFPCTDLSHAGEKAGIFGPQSGLVEHAFRIAGETRPEWIVLENVPNLLLLHSGAGITHVVDKLEELGYSWAYRTVDSRFTGVPQRRNRVILLASLTHDPAVRLLSGHAGANHQEAAETSGTTMAPHGFYWTEGRNGIGLVSGAIPTLKGGSALGTPSAPAIWVPGASRGRKFVLPRIEDVEALQGLPRGWTSAAAAEGEPDLRWKLVGNAVTVGVGSWVAQCILDEPNDRVLVPGDELARSTRWPKAAAGGPGHPAVQYVVSDHPTSFPMVALGDVVDFASAPALSHRATKGFLSRVDERANRKVNEAWYSDLEDHLAATRPPLPPESASWASSPTARTRMQRQKQRNTKPEIAMRRELSALGLRYQLQIRPIPELRRRLDIVFKGAKVAVDVRGCFWHACPEHSTKPKLNADKWSEKLRRNRERDEETVQALAERGWHTVVVWEHDDYLVKAKEVAAIVEARRPMRRLGHDLMPTESNQGPKARPGTPRHSDMSEDTR